MRGWEGRKVVEMPLDSKTILVVGNDAGLAYLLTRYAGQCNLSVITAAAGSALDEAVKAHPAMILFTSLNALRESRAWLPALGGLESKIMACAAVGEVALARELGADGCLLHPLTFDGFASALAASCGA